MDYSTKDLFILAFINNVVKDTKKFMGFANRHLTLDGFQFCPLDCRKWYVNADATDNSVEGHNDWLSVKNRAEVNGYASFSHAMLNVLDCNKLLTDLDALSTPTRYKVMTEFFNSVNKESKALTNDGCKAVALMCGVDCPKASIYVGLLFNSGNARAILLDASDDVETTYNAHHLGGVDATIGILIEQYNDCVKREGNKNEPLLLNTHKYEVEFTTTKVVKVVVEATDDEDARSIASVKVATNGEGETTKESIAITNFTRIC